MLNFNRNNFADRSLNQTLNELIERAEPPSKNYRQYLGASAIGAECLRKVQFDWMCDPQFPARIKDIFERGHFFEEVTRQHLIAAGFQFAPAERLKFEAINGLFRGHADGIIIAGPELPALIYPCIWEACLKAKSWRTIERDGLIGPYRSTRRKWRSIKLIWIARTLRFSASSMPIRLSDCPSPCRSMHSSHKQRLTALSL